MKIPLTLYNLLEQKARTLIAVTGIAFTVLLIFMQIGFYDSGRRAATFLLDSLNFDVALISADYLEINRPGDFPRQRVYQARAVPGVRSALPCYIGSHYWRIVAAPAPASEAIPADTERQGFQRAMTLVGFSPAEPVFRDAVVTAQAHELTVPGHVLLDSETRHFFGKRGVGVETELGALKVKVVGTCTIGSGYGADGLAVVSDRTFARVFGNVPLTRVNLGLLTVADGADPAAVADRVRAHLDAADVHVVTREQLLDRDRNFWLRQTSLGVIFTAGVLVALTVGGVFVYLVLATDIANRFAEYATLKAIGYSNGYLAGLVVRQALIYAVLGYLPGLGAAAVLYWFGRWQVGLPLELTAGKAWLVFGLGVTMTCVSALFAVRKVQQADPADLF